MRVSMRWLEELVELPEGMTPAKVAERLTLQGLEVEGLIDIGAPLEGVVLAKVQKRAPHPNADKLSVCEIDAGGGVHVQVVCGASNFQEGDLVALATVGTKLPGGVLITKATLRGVESEGMLCSEKELGLGNDSAGILVIPPAEDLEVGMPLARALMRDDVVLEIGVTPNRPDALSHLGIARELIAAGAKSRLKAPQCAERAGPIDGFANVTIKDSEGCPRYACRVIVDVKVGPSPEWVRARLAACGVRSINNVVDVTNLVMMERGLPLHAFDLDRIAKERDRAEVIVRAAEAGEKIVTLDDQERELAAGDVVIADPSGPIAIAGVMGGAATEVTPKTRRILLEGAYFDPGRVRRAGRRLGLHSEASHRFERGCDPNGVQQSLDRAASLLAELGEGSVARGTLDVYPRKIQPLEVRLRPDRAARLLGLSHKELDEATCSRLLLGIGLEVVGRDGDGMRFRIPTFRPDLAREVDLVEEILRLIGYDKVPPTLPNRSGEGASLFNARRDRVERLTRRALRAAGFYEAVNLAFASPADDEAYAYGGSGPVRIKNPLGEEMSLLRRSLLPGLVRNVATNHRRGVEDVRLFEVGTVFLGPSEGGKQPQKDRAAASGADAWAHEEHRIAGVLTGARRAASFDESAPAADFYDLKGVVEEVLTGLGLDVQLGISPIRFAPDEDGPSFLHPRSRCVVRVPPLGGGEPRRVAVLGELHPDLAAGADLKRSALMFEIHTAALAACVPSRPAAEALPRFPSVRRDLALVVDDAVTAAALTETLAGTEGVRPLLEELAIFDVYRGEHVPRGKKSVALSFVLRAPDRTLTDAEIAEAADALVARARSLLGAEIRA